jgi:hypothetical protein
VTTRRRRTVDLSILVLIIAVVGGFALVSVFGGSASNKFSSVGSAVSDVDAPRKPRTGPANPVGPAADSDKSAAPSPGPTAQGSERNPGQNPAANAPAGSSSFAVNAIDSPIAAGRAFVSTASMTVQTDDLAGAANRAITTVTQAGGGLFGEQSSFHGEAKSILTFKVPPERFRPVMTELAALGKLLSEEVKTDDVTAQVIDLDARISAAESTLGRTRALLDNARSLAEITSLENEVSRRQADLENLRGQQRALRERTDLATITLTLTMPAPPTEPVPTTIPPPQPRPGFTDGLDRGWDSFTAFGSIVLAGVGLVLPYTLIVVPIGVVALAVRRRRRRLGGVARPPTPDPGPGPSTPGPAVATPTSGSSLV